MVFLELWQDSRVTTGNSGSLLCWPREDQSPSSCEVNWGMIPSQGRAKRPHLGLCPETPCSPPSPVVTGTLGLNSRFTRGVILVSRESKGLCSPLKL